MGSGGSLASWDEAIYATLAKNIFQTGDWWTLRFNNQVWFDKPPLSIWGTALAFKLFGVNEFGARFFSALCGVGTVCTTYFLGRSLFNRWTGFISGLVLLSSVHFFRFARFGVTDTPLVFFMTLSLTLFWIGRKRDSFLFLSGIAFGLAVLTKSFGAMPVLIVTWLFAFATGQPRLLLQPAYVLGLIAGCLVFAPWYVLGLTTHTNSILRNEVWFHLFRRTTTALDGHVGKWTYYFHVIVNKYRPWILVGFISWPLFVIKAVRKRKETDVFLALWITVVFVLFTLTKTKLGWYILPIYPALSVTVAYILVKVLRENKQILTVCLFTAIMLLHIPYSHLIDHDYSRDIKGIAGTVMAEVPKGTRLYLYKYHEDPALTFYTGREGAYIDNESELLNQIKSENFYCLIHSNDLELLSDAFENNTLRICGSFEKIKLISNDMK